MLLFMSNKEFELEITGGPIEGLAYSLLNVCALVPGCQSQSAHGAPSTRENTVPLCNSNPLRLIWLLQGSSKC